MVLRMLTGCLFMLHLVGQAELLEGGKEGFADGDGELLGVELEVVARGLVVDLQDQYEADLKSMQDELQKKGEAFDKEQATLPDNIKQRRQQELQDMYTKIQQSFQDNQQALQKASGEKMQAIQTKVLDAIKSVGTAGNYVYIMENNSLPYISTTLSTDVTAQVKAKLGLK